jgi:hypothetical protein
VTPSSVRNTHLNCSDAGAYLTAPVAPTNAAHQSPQAAPDIGAAHRSLPNAGDLQMTSPIRPITLCIDMEQDEITSPLSPSTLGIHMGLEEMEQPVEAAAQRDSAELYLPRAASEGGVGLGPGKPPPPPTPSPPPGTPSGRRGCTYVAPARARTGAGGGGHAAGVGSIDYADCPNAGNGDGADEAGNGDGIDEVGNGDGIDQVQVRTKMGSSARTRISSGGSTGAGSPAINSKGHDSHATHAAHAASPHAKAGATGMADDIEVAYKEKEEEEAGAAACTSPVLLLFLPALCAVIGMAICVAGVTLVTLDKDQNPAASSALRTGEGSVSSRRIAVPFVIGRHVIRWHAGASMCALPWRRQLTRLSTHAC